MAQGLERAMDVLEAVFDELDREEGKINHDRVKERIAAAMAAAQVRRVQLMDGQLKLKAERSHRQLASTK